jgi:hypothetical protein
MCICVYVRGLGRRAAVTGYVTRPRTGDDGARVHRRARVHLGAAGVAAAAKHCGALLLLRAADACALWFTLPRLPRAIIIS